LKYWKKQRNGDKFIKFISENDGDKILVRRIQIALEEIFEINTLLGNLFTHWNYEKNKYDYDRKKFKNEKK
jgi:hypothetical protein